MSQFVLPPSLANCNHVLIAGAGGGFDIYAGIPLYEALVASGTAVSLANLSFSHLANTDAKPMVSGLYEITSETAFPGPYFPEGVLARFFANRGRAVSIYSFEKTGVAPLKCCYQFLIEHLGIDAIILVDGGTDILMRGDEAGLGTPEEDMASLAAVSGLDVATKLVYCLGFGIDTYHGVCHAQFLENVAALSRSGGFLGVQSLLPSMPESELYLEAVRFSEEHMAFHPSIVNTSIASALEGKFGDVHRTERTRSSELFISPLMSMYWAFELGSLVDEHLYLSTLTDSETIWDLQFAIQAFRSQTEARERQAIPH